MGTDQALKYELKHKNYKTKKKEVWFRNTLLYHRYTNSKQLKFFDFYFIFSIHDLVGPPEKMFSLPNSGTGFKMKDIYRSRHLIFLSICQNRIDYNAS